MSTHATSTYTTTQRFLGLLISKQEGSPSTLAADIHQLFSTMLNSDKICQRHVVAIERGQLETSVTLTKPRFSVWGSQEQQLKTRGPVTPQDRERLAKTHVEGEKYAKTISCSLETSTTSRRTKTSREDCNQMALEAAALFRQRILKEDGSLEMTSTFPNKTSFNMKTQTMQFHSIAQR